MSVKNRIDKVLIIGLDCADPNLVFERFYDDLPTLAGLAGNGMFGVMQSIIPPITVPAWSCMASSKDPGQLGLYGMRNRANRSYDKLTIATSLSVKEPRLWDIVGRAGRKSFVFGVPQTYPPTQVNGEMISCFFTPSAESEFTYPRELKSEITSLVGEYLIDVKGYRTENKDWLLEQIYQITDQRFKLARHFLTNHEWDLFWMVEMGPDRIHHGFWQYMDPQHHRYRQGNRFENAIHDYYKALDSQIATLLERIDRQRTAVWIVSDHGAKRMTGGVCFNDWLIEQGYLVLKDEITQPTRFADVNIDWSKTKAWGEGGYYGRCFINLRGREPQGLVSPGEYDAICRELIDKLQAMPDHEGRPMGTKVYRPHELYRTVNGIPPDLIVLFGNLDWRSVGTVGNESIFTFKNDTGPDDANHAIDGMFICSDPRARTGRREISIFDMAPTVLTQMGLPVPHEMIGKNLLEP